jgi:hypothetical protein
MSASQLRGERKNKVALLRVLRAHFAIFAVKSLSSAQFVEIVLLEAVPDCCPGMHPARMMQRS